MSNNRMFLRYRPTGREVYLGKRGVGSGYWNVPDALSQAVTALFDHAAEHMTANGIDHEDDFEIAFESTPNWPGCFDEQPIEVCGQCG